MPRPGRSRPPQLSDARGVLAAQRAHRYPQRAHRAAGRRGQPGVRRPAATPTRPTCPAWPTSPPRCSTRARRRATPCRSPTKSRSSAPRSRTASTMDAIQFAVTSLAAQFPRTLDLLADVTLTRRSRRTRSSGSAPPAWRTCVRRRESGADRRAGHGPALYGSAHPYGYLDLGTEASNKALSRDAMVDFWKQHFVPGNAALVVVGAIIPQAARAARGEGVRGMAGEAAPASTPPHPRDTPRKAGHRRRAGSPADAGEGRRHRRAAVHARLRGAPGDEHAARGAVLQPDQPEPPRGQGLHLRRVLRSRSGKKRARSTPGPACAPTSPRQR